MECVGMDYVEITKKIDSYAKAHYNELKKEEASLNKKMSKYDIAQLMLAKGALKENEFISWMNTREGFESSKLTEQQEKKLLSGNIWSFANGENISYLETLSLDKNDTTTFNNIYGLEISPNALESNPIHKEMVERYNKIESPNYSYTEIMDAIRANNMSNEEQLEFLLKRTGEKFYEAKEKGDKATMKETLLQGFGLVFAVMDENIGITDFKEFLKDTTGLNSLVEKIDDFVDNGDVNSLSLGETVWNVAKGAGDIVDSMIGTKGLAFAGSLVAATEAATACGLGKIFSIGLQTAFTYNGVSLTIEGATGLYNATTEEDARKAGQDLTAGGLLLYGTYKSIKQSYSNYKAQKASLEKNLAEAKETLGLKDNYTLNELKHAYRELCKTEHPDKGGTIEKFDKITDAYDLLLKHLNSSPILNPTKECQTQTSTTKESSNLPSITTTKTNPKVDMVGSTAAFTGAEGTTNTVNISTDASIDGISDATTPTLSTDIPTNNTIVPITEFKTVPPSTNYFPGYRNGDGSINLEKVSKHFTDTRRALQTPENAVEKVILDGYPRRNIETLAKDYPLFTQYFVNALENGFANSPANKSAVEKCSYSDPNLIKYAEEYLAKGFTFKDITSYHEFESKIRMNQKLSPTLKSYSPTTQQKYLDFVYKTNTEYAYQGYYSGLKFVVENIPNEKFLLECLENPAKFNEISNLQQEIMQPFAARTTSKVYEINYQDLLKVADFSKIKSQLVLMKMYYPENYDALINSEGFRAIVWNFNPNTIRLLENLQYDKPITPKNLAGVDVTEVLKSKNVITEEMAKGSHATNFNLNDRIGNNFKTNLEANAKSKGLTYQETTNANGSKSFVLTDQAGNVKKVYTTNNFNPRKIGEIQQNFYDRYGRQEANVSYSAIDNKFTIKIGSKTETLYSYKEFKTRYPKLSFDSEIQSFVWINDNGFNSRLTR